MWQSLRSLTAGDLMRNFVIAAAGMAATLVAALAQPTMAHAADQATWERCKGNDANAKITACTTIIDSKEASANERFSALHNRGYAYGMKSEWGRAVADFNAAILLNPKSSVTFNNRGWAHIQLKDYDRAIDDLSESIRLDPKYAVALRNRGFAYNE